MTEQPEVVMYGTATCPYCAAARTLLDRKSVEYTEISVANDSDKRARMEKLSGGRTVPQIIIDGEPIGGFDELYELDASGQLDELLQRG